MNPDDDLLAEDRGKVASRRSRGPVVMLDGDSAVLRVPAFDDIQIGDDLEPADDRRGHGRLDEQDILKLAVDPVANSQAVLLRIEMNIRGLAVAGALQDLVDQLGQGRGRRLFPGGLCGHRGDAGCDWVKGTPADRLPTAAAVAVVGGQVAQSLECQMVEQIGRDQIELEDRLAQVAIVLLAVDLGNPDLLGGQRPFLSKTVSKASSTEKARQDGFTGGSSAAVRSSAVDPRAGGKDGAGEESTTETSSAYGSPWVPTRPNRVPDPRCQFEETFTTRRVRSEQRLRVLFPNFTALPRNFRRMPPFFGFFCPEKRKQPATGAT